MYRRQSELLEFVRSQRSQTNLLSADQDSIPENGYLPGGSHPGPKKIERPISTIKHTELLQPRLMRPGPHMANQFASMSSLVSDADPIVRKKKKKELHVGNNQTPYGLVKDGKTVSS